MVYFLALSCDICNNRAFRPSDMETFPVHSSALLRLPSHMETFPVHSSALLRLPSHMETFPVHYCGFPTICSLCIIAAVSLWYVPCALLRPASLRYVPCALLRAASLWYVPRALLRFPCDMLRVHYCAFPAIWIRSVNIIATFCLQYEYAMCA